jgi:hypothetical protein
MYVAAINHEACMRVVAQLESESEQSDGLALHDSEGFLHLANQTVDSLLIDEFGLMQHLRHGE